MNTSIEKVKQMVTDVDIQKAVGLVFACLAWEETVRPVVREYQKKVLAEIKFVSVQDGKILTSPEEAWLMHDQAFEIYLKRCNDERIKAGLYVETQEHCPLLVAEDNTRKAKRALLYLSAKYTDIDAAAIFYSIKNYRKYIDLVLQIMAGTVDKKAIMENLK